MNTKMDEGYGWRKEGRKEKERGENKRPKYTHIWTGLWKRVIV